MTTKTTPKLTKKSAAAESSSAAKKPAPKFAGTKDVQKLQRAVVDGLEDVKAQDIQVFDTEEQSALFERVIVASGTSNRQTKALAASVVDKVREEGFPKPRIEGEGNGEWIIVDCGYVVVHVMQPTIREYYRLEELWGQKPVRLKLGAAKPLVKAEVPAAPATKGAGKGGDKSLPSLRRSSAAKKGVEEAFPSKAALRKAAEKKSPSKKSTAAKSPAKKAVALKSPIQKLVVNAATPKSPSKTSPKAPTKKAIIKKVPSRAVTKAPISKTKK